MDPSGTSRRTWYVLHLHCLLLSSLADSLSRPSRPIDLTSTVGEQAVLPCSWKSRVNQATPSVCHVQWENRLDTVYEQMGEVRWQAEEFVGRAEISEERLRLGDCSLTIKDVQIIDTGMYQSFMVVDGPRDKQRVFIQTVKLSIFDHKSQQSRGPGEDLVLELHTPHSVRVVFQSRNSSEWANVWMRGDQDSERLEKHPAREQLSLKGVKRTDEGFYKVLDEHGLAVSTVQLSVEEGSTASKHQQILLPGVATVNICSLPLIGFVLLVINLL